MKEEDRILCNKVDEHISLVQNIIITIKEVSFFLEFILRQFHGEDAKGRSCVLNVETTKKINLFGRYDFGCGTHRKSIDIPQSVIDKLIPILQGYLNENKEKLKSVNLKSINEGKGEM